MCNSFYDLMDFWNHLIMNHLMLANRASWEIIHTDVCGPMNIEVRSRYHYFLTFTDDLSIYGYICLMKQKSETFEKFIISE